MDSLAVHHDPVGEEMAPDFRLAMELFSGVENMCLGSQNHECVASAVWMATRAPVIALIALCVHSTVLCGLAAPVALSSANVRRTTPSTLALHKRGHDQCEYSTIWHTTYIKIYRIAFCSNWAYSGDWCGSILDKWRNQMGPVYNWQCYPIDGTSVWYATVIPWTISRGRGWRNSVQGGFSKAQNGGNYSLACWWRRIAPTSS
ncbi:hypothetical protein M427DRAFT_44231 [Gonapodya prolifera JEL478]|uniref:Uncharacterized protein n=1 Tax=Gonapodya prolifera (strain JEL478) TaxID=1344416 RepID=A0A139AHH7_GONPJ|nr:hypothetical protein M427DRAFT_44231 [Gonapodya prolifera JEL478]|eukprot:KXS15863.1 hypothetical protein M427DRAFT_44231 [Gonapodya prolifera JEL478]